MGLKIRGGKCLANVFRFCRTQNICGILWSYRICQTSNQNTFRFVDLNLSQCDPKAQEGRGVEGRWGGHSTRCTLFPCLSWVSPTLPGSDCRVLLSGAGQATAVSWAKRRTQGGWGEDTYFHSSYFHVKRYPWRILLASSPLAFSVPSLGTRMTRLIAEPGRRNSWGPACLHMAYILGSCHCMGSSAEEACCFGGLACFRGVLAHSFSLHTCARASTHLYQ